MTDLLTSYAPTVAVFGAIGSLFLIQLLIVDVVGIMSGHQPGGQVEQAHERLLFRVVRAHANTNESVAAFILLALFGMMLGVNPARLNACAVVYFVGRAAHMLCYYMNLKLMRSISFGVSLLGLIGMLIIGWVAWFGN